MAESLESRVRHLKSRLEGLKQLYADKERPTEIDLEIQGLTEQLDTLVEPVLEQDALH